jgi:hypothetical protein
MIEKNGINDMYTIQEALSRARMPQPQNIPSEAARSARQIAMNARQRAARERNGG